tara:strand:+ start:99 stop:440 length:342 start_codon:yes stop_codon:yes gene_type:complete
LLPKAYKLHKAKEFSSVIQFRCVENSNFLQVFVKPNNQSHSRLGLIVPVKIERLSVKRNQVKRVLRIIFCEQQKNSMGLDLVVRLRRPVTRTDLSKIKEEYKALLIKLQRCCG